MASNLRRCRECKEEKLLSEFSTDDKRSGSTRRLCKKCASNMQSKRYHGQGATGRERARKNYDEFFKRDPVRARYNLAKNAAKQSGHEWCITLDEFRLLNDAACYYCGGSLPEKGRGLDRINNRDGYVLKNVIPCCSSCNSIRGDKLSPDEMLAAMGAVAKLRSGKLSNPKDVIGSTKLPLSLVPETSLAWQAMAHLHGAMKYGAWNWRTAGVRVSIYVDAIKRHIAAWWSGEDFDRDSGLPHLAHVVACCNILLDAHFCKMLTDDRPAPLPVGDLIAKCNAMTKEWVENKKSLHANPEISPG